MDQVQRLLSIYIQHTNKAVLLLVLKSCCPEIRPERLATDVDHAENPKTLVNASIEINNYIDSSHEDLSCDKYDYCCSV